MAKKAMKQVEEPESSSEDEEQQYASSSSSGDESAGEDDDMRAMGYGENEEEDATSSDGDDDDDSEGDGDDDDSDASDDDKEREIYTGEEGCTLDLRNLTAINSHQVNTQTLYKKSKKNSKKKQSSSDFDDKMLATIPPAEGAVKVNEEQLLETAREGCTQILKGLWSLDTERTDAGPLAVLPQMFEIKTPRELVSFFRVVLAICR